MSDAALVTTQEQPAPLVVAADPLSLIRLAIQTGTDPDKLDRLLTLQERCERYRAAEEFSRALAAFQAACPPITKLRKAGKDGALAYQYADLADVMTVAAPILAQQGLAVTFSTETRATTIVCVCHVRKGIHVEDTSVELPIPQMRVNETQRLGAAISYARRYAICAALNIVVANEDPDAQTLTQKQPSAKDPQLAELEGLLRGKSKSWSTAMVWLAKATGNGYDGKTSWGRIADADRTILFEKLRSLPDKAAQPQQPTPPQPAPAPPAPPEAPRVTHLREMAIRKGATWAGSMAWLAKATGNGYDGKTLPSTIPDADWGKLVQAIERMPDKQPSTPSAAATAPAAPVVPAPEPYCPF